MEGMSIIVIICYIFGEMIKKIFKERINKYIPIILTILGGILGLIIYLTNQELLSESTNIYEAIIIGFINGNSATGTNQIIKQLTKKEAKDEESIL